MVAFRLSLLLVLLASSSAMANVYSRTNDVLALNPSANPMSVQPGSQFRMYATTRSGGAAFDLNSYTIRFNLTDPVDDYLILTGITAIVNATNGEFSVRINATNTALLELGRQYRGVSGAYTGNTLIATLSDDYINIVETYCSTCGVSGGGGGATSVVVTNIISSTNIVSVTITNVGGGGSGTLSGFNSATTGGVFLVVSNGWDASITNDGNVFTVYTGLPKGATGVNQVATWNGTNWIATALGAPTPTPVVGTNVIKWTTVWGVTNTWVAPSTQIMFTVWGATGGGGSGGGGHSRALWVGSAGTIFDIIIGTRGLNGVSTNNGPFAGAGINGGSTNQQNGGGATYIAISGTTNIILIAGGAGGGGWTAGGSGSGAGGPGGGFWRGTTDGSGTLGTNLIYGTGGWASNEYGLAATGGVNASAFFNTTNFSHYGIFLRGGHASTNGCVSGATGLLGGGGGGWYGGAGAVRSDPTNGSSGSGAGGGGGLGFANTNYVTFAQIMAGLRPGTIGVGGTIGGPPVAQDHPTYTAGRAVGSAQSANGTDGCAGAMW